MTISRERLYEATCAVHRAAEQAHLAEGAAAMAALFLPPTGGGDLFTFPTGLPPAEELAGVVRVLGTAAIVLTGEVVESTLDDTAPAGSAPPQPDPNAAEAIFTTAVGICPDGTVTMLRRTLIRRTGHSSVLYEAADLSPGDRDEGPAAVLAAVLAVGNPGLRPSPAASPDRPIPPGLPGTPVDGVLDDPVCPDCPVRIGQLHAERCDIFPIESSC